MTATLNLAFRSPDGLIEVKACHVLCKRVFNNPDSPAIPLPVETPKRLVLGCYAGDKLVGTGRIECVSRNSAWWQVSSLAVDHRYRERHHIGSSLLARLEEYARSFGCERINLSTSRYASDRGFYENRGYQYKYPGRRSSAIFKDLRPAA